MSDWYRRVWPLLRPLPEDLAHALGLLALRAPFSLGARAVEDPFRWPGLALRNRVGIAAGLDKDGRALAGLDRLGAGFAEIGTILPRPWAGSPLRPRLARLEAEGALWNRLGFPSEGVHWVVRRLARFAARQPRLQVFCNVAPHPLTLRAAGESPGYLRVARAELAELVGCLHPVSAAIVVNLSSPNTPGLRSLLYGRGFAEEWIAPTRERLRALDRESGRAGPTPLLVKLPPEDAERRPWTEESLAAVVAPLAKPDVCDGFVAVNTSARLALERVDAARPDAPGGLSGRPLLESACAAQRLLRELAAPSQLRVGVGGVDSPQAACALVEAGAQLVEIYTGLVYRGPGLVGECAEALRRKRPAPA